MLWDKRKYILKIKGGCGQLITDGFHGLIQQLLVSPQTKDTIWSMDIFDRDNDLIYKIHDHEGQLNDRQGLPVGKDQPERLTVRFYELTKNEDMSVIFNIKEVR